MIKRQKDDKYISLLNTIQLLSITTQDDMKTKQKFTLAHKQNLDTMLESHEYIIKHYKIGIIEYCMLKLNIIILKPMLKRVEKRTQ